MAEITPLINGKAYEWADITINIMGVPVNGIEGIKYEEEQAMQNNYGIGNRPVSRGFGQITATGSITLHAEEINSLIKSTGVKRIQEIPEFDVIVSFSPGGTGVMTHKLKKCRFFKNTMDTKAGDMKITLELPLIISEIEWNE